jgi:hypothetical protein
MSPDAAGKEITFTASLLSSMSGGRMRLVACSEGVTIHCPDDGKFSFFNSPYPAHASYAGVDVYPKGSFGDAAPSPVAGEVRTVRMVRCPQGRGFEGSTSDYVILLRSSDNPERWVKILHVEPSVKVGDVVRPGEGLGTVLRSGFFDFWTDPHIHVEVRQPSDALRARGGFKLERLMKLDVSEAAEDLTGTVVETTPEYSLVALNEESKHGIAVDLDGQVGLLDAGLPHYRWFGVHTDIPPPPSGTIRLCGSKIGNVRSAYSNMCVAEHCGSTFALNGKPVGLSLHLAPSVPLAKIIPLRNRSLGLRKFEEVCITVSSTS